MAVLRLSSSGNTKQGSLNCHADFRIVPKELPETYFIREAAKNPFHNVDVYDNPLIRNLAIDNRGTIRKHKYIIQNYIDTCKLV